VQHTADALLLFTDVLAVYRTPALPFVTPSAHARTCTPPFGFSSVALAAAHLRTLLSAGHGAISDGNLLGLQAGRVKLARWHSELALPGRGRQLRLRLVPFCADAALPRVLAAVRACERLPLNAGFLVRPLALLPNRL